ncbi:uncharacterized [Tachysurus ichikawai]
MAGFLIKTNAGLPKEAEFERHVSGYSICAIAFTTDFSIHIFARRCGLLELRRAEEGCAAHSHHPEASHHSA